MSEELEIRRAKRGDLPAIARLVEQATRSKTQLDEAEVLDWLLSKGVWVALRAQELVGVAAWQAENLVSVTDVFYVFPDLHWAKAGRQLIETVEAEAKTLMCEINAVFLPAWTSDAGGVVFRQEGYEAQRPDELHRIWREVLSDFVSDGSVLMVKRLRDRMRMVPL